MKKKYRLIIYVIIIILITLGFFYYKNKLFNTAPKYDNIATKEQNTTVDIENKIKEFFNVMDVEKDIDKYNKLVTANAKLTRWNIPDNIDSRNILEVKEIDYNDYLELKQEMNSKYSNKKDSIRYFMVGCDVKYKEGKPAVGNSGIYYIVMTIEKENGQWLITNNTHQATYKNGKLSIDS